MTSKSISKAKSNLFFILSGIFIANAVIAEIIGVKLFSFEKTLGIPAAQLPWWNGNTLDFNLSAGVMLWPLVFILSDIINEYFGTEGVKKVTYFGVIIIAYTSMVLSGVNTLQPADFWVQTRTDFNINTAFTALFGQSIHIIIGSIIAFITSQLLDASIFQFIKKRAANTNGSKGIWLRATLSTAISQLIDSYLILLIAFYWLGNWPIEQVLQVGTVQYIYKMGMTIVLIPLLYIVHAIIDNYLAKAEE